MKYLCISLALLTLPVYINETAEEIYCISDTAIMSQQNSEILIEQNADICMPDKRVNGLVTKYREEINISKKEKNILCRIVEAEAGGENISGRMLVANVIINRVLCDEFADDIEGVVFAHNGGVYQFSPICDGRYYSVHVSRTTKKAVERALSGEDNSRGARYFVAGKYADSDNLKWFRSSLKYLFSYGCHEFYK